MRALKLFALMGAVAINILTILTVTFRLDPGVATLLVWCLFPVAILLVVFVLIRKEAL